MAVKNDEMIVAAMDAQFQLGAKENDAAIKDRILAEDFVLVTEHGKVFTKAGVPFEYRLWFSDAYVRTPKGWRDVFWRTNVKAVILLKDSAPNQVLI